MKLIDAALAALNFAEARFHELVDRPRRSPPT
jgi:hypothetical protein